MHVCERVCGGAGRHGQCSPSIAGAGGWNGDGAASGVPSHQDFLPFPICNMRPTGSNGISLLVDLIYLACSISPYPAQPCLVLHPLSCIAGMPGGGLGAGGDDDDDTDGEEDEEEGRRTTPRPSPSKSQPSPSPVTPATHPSASSTAKTAAGGTPRLRTRLFAAGCLLEIPGIACAADPRHADIIAAQAAGAGGGGGWLVFMLQRWVDLAFKMASGQLEVRRCNTHIHVCHAAYICMAIASPVPLPPPSPQVLPNNVRQF
jgi:hypothetical protein